jgi:tRNA threonylcarbamoyladenosine biosynthesis protein TsaB
MRVLAIDTATSCGVVGIAEDGRPVGELSLISRENHSARLLPSIDWLLSMAGWRIEEIDGFGVTLGPGSFTGLRVGLSTVKGLAWALNKPVAGFGSLEILAAGAAHDGTKLVPMLDARKGRVYGGAFQNDGTRLETVLPTADLPVADLIRSIEGPLLCLGEGARTYRAEIEKLGRGDLSFAPLELDLPKGATIARLTGEALLRGETIDIRRAEPAYLRASEAERKQNEATTIP